VADGDHAVRPGEDVHLAELDALLVIDVPRRDRERGLPILLALGPLVRDDGVFDRERMQAELPRHRADLGCVRPVQADPRHPVPVPQQFVGLLQAARVRRALPVDVNRVIDKCHVILVSAIPPAAGQVMPTSAVRAPCRP
jgi:hypothetical protein